MHNVYQQFRQLLSDPPLRVGTVTDVASGVVRVQLPGGGLVKARGNAEIGQNVFVRDGVVEAVAPSLAVEIIEV